MTTKIKTPEDAQKLYDFDAEMAKPTWQDAEWDTITKKHADAAASRAVYADLDAIRRQGAKEERAKLKKMRHKNRAANNAAFAGKYAVLAIGLTALGYITRDITWLAITLGVIALAFGLTAAVGVGKYSEM